MEPTGSPRKHETYRFVYFIYAQNINELDLGYRIQLSSISIELIFHSFILIEGPFLF